MVVKKKLNLTKALIAASFFISIIAFVTPVMAYESNRILSIAKGDDLDLSGATNFIIGKIEFGGGDELPSAQVFFHQKFYEDSGGKVYEMKGWTKNGVRLTDQLAFYCPVFNVYFINAWLIQGEGVLKTTDTDFEVFFRNSFPITMPNSGGKYIPAYIFMMLSFTAEYCEKDPFDPLYPPGSPQNPVLILPEGGWAVAGVLWDVGIPMDVGFGYGILPVGPFSYLTKYMGI